MGTLLYYAIPAFVLLLVVEAIWGVRSGHHLHEASDSAASLAMGLGNVAVSAVVQGGILALHFGLYELRLFDLGREWWVWVLLIVCEDFCYYWFHRAHHEVRVLWAAHVNHHSSQNYNLATALRQSWTTPLTGLIFWLPLPLLGFHPLMIVTAQAISLIYQFWIHTETIERLGPLEWVFNTPSHHRVHHGSDLEYLDRNHGGILIIWDRLFGTFQAEGERPRYGLIEDIDTRNPVRIAFHEFAAMVRDLWRAPSWSARWQYVFGPPGWSHDGSKKTVEQMREEREGAALGDGAVESP
jgi:sterol desaturase/sphingolipid hydroxylase (fatty acid hydroxylase superfamily)